MNARGWASFLLLGFVWGGSFLFVKIIGRDLPPFTLVTARLGLASLGLWVLMLLTRTPPPASRKEALGLVLLGAGVNGFTFVLIAVGQQYIDSSVSAVLNSTTPLFTLALAHFMLPDEPLTWRGVVGMLVGFAGIVVISVQDISVAGTASWPALFGQGLIIAASILLALTAILTRRFFHTSEPLVTSTITISSSFLVVGVLALIFERPISFAMRPDAVVSLLVLSLAGTSFANYLYYDLIRHWGATRTTLVTYVIPVVALVLGVLILHESTDWRLFVGLALVLGAIAITSVSPASRRAPRS